MDTMKTTTIRRVFGQKLNMVEFSTPGGLGICFLQRDDMGIGPVKQLTQFDQVGAYRLTIQKHLVFAVFTTMRHIQCHDPQNGCVNDIQRLVLG